MQAAGAYYGLVEAQNLRGQHTKQNEDDDETNDDDEEATSMIDEN